jgi:hypothetical protein
MQPWVAQAPHGADTYTKYQDYMLGFGQTEPKEDVGVLSMSSRDDHISMDNASPFACNLKNFTKQVLCKNAPPLIHGRLSHFLK